MNGSSSESCIDQVILRVKLDVSIIWRGVKVVGKLHEVSVNFTIMSADDLAVLDQLASHSDVVVSSALASVFACFPIFPYEATN